MLLAGRIGAVEGETAAAELEAAEDEDAGVSMALDRKAIAPSYSSGLACANVDIEDDVVAAAMAHVAVVVNFMAELWPCLSEPTTTTRDKYK